MVRICWRRSRGLQVDCVASGPRPYWMLPDVPCSGGHSSQSVSSVCRQHFDTHPLSAHPLPPCRPAWPVSSPVPAPCSNLLVVTGRNRAAAAAAGWWVQSALHLQSVVGSHALAGVAGPP